MLKGKLFKAVKGADIDEIKSLLEYGVDPNIIDMTGLSPLRVAVVDHEDPIAIVKLLISYGADVNFQTPMYANSILSQATYKRNHELVRLLIAHGADVNRANARGITPIFNTFENGDLVNFSYLIAHGANINHQDTSGNTLISTDNALSYMKEYSDKGRLLKMLSILLDHDVDLHLKNNEGLTFLDQINDDPDYSEIVGFIGSYQDKNALKSYLNEQSHECQSFYF